MNIPIIVLGLVFAGIAARRIGNVRLEIWHIMGAGALAVLIAGSISIPDAIRAINPDVMGFLFGMFVIGEALEESGYLAHRAYAYFKRASSVDGLMLLILFGFGGASALLMNDTLAIVGTPVVLLLARKHGLPARMLLLALAFSVTIGSVTSPIGNPQNLLIALNGTFRNPFADFIRWLFVPTVVNLLAAFWILRRMYRSEWHDARLAHSQEPIRDHTLAFLGRIALVVLMALLVIKAVGVSLGLVPDIRLTTIALVSCLPILIGSRKRKQLLFHLDWRTLAFFAAMFVLMESVWQTGFFQRMIGREGHALVSPEMILVVSVVVSQFVSNVPLVALVQPVLQHGGAATAEFMALAAGSTVAGNMFILGAASNVIIIQNAEKRSHETVTFREFARVGVPLTIVNILVFWIWFHVL